MTHRQLGRLPDPEHKRDMFRQYRVRAAVKAGMQDDSTIVQPFAYEMDQRSLPSCVGKSLQGCLNALLNVDASGVNLWIESRAIDDNLMHGDYGTTAASAIEVILENGWTQRTDPNEDSLSGHSLTELPALSSVLAGDDNRIATAINHETFIGNSETIHYAILAALREKDSSGRFINGIVFGTGVNSAYMTPPADMVLDQKYLSANGALGGHEQRIVGWVKEREAYVIGNSWGRWTYCIVNGKKTYGHCLVARSVVETAWDIDKVRLV